MPILPIDFLEKVLLLGVVLILAAVIGGGLDAVNIIRIPIISDWRVRSGIGVFGAAIMLFAYSSLEAASKAQVAAEGQAKEAQAVAAFALHYENLVKGAAGVPPPRWPDERIKDELQPLAASAGSDVGMNCTIAGFISVHAISYNYWPAIVRLRIVDANQGGSGTYLDCYRKAIATATAERSRNSCTVGYSTTSDGYRREAAGDTEVPMVGFAAFEDVAYKRSLGDSGARAFGNEIAQATEVAPKTAGTSILEAIASVGQSGWIFLGGGSSGQLGNDRTIVETGPQAGRIATVREPVNLRAAGLDTNYRAHKILSVIPPGAKILIKALTPASEFYRWAFVVIVALPRS